MLAILLMSCAIANPIGNHGIDHGIPTRYTDTGERIAYDRKPSPLFRQLVEHRKGSGHRFGQNALDLGVVGSSMAWPM